jgi:putative CocE/NonD family hydrolase
MTRLFLSLCFGMGAAMVVGAADRGPIPEPTPRYTVRVEKSVRVPMSDGVWLSTDLYLPQGKEDRWPVILLRTPYSKTGFGGRMEKLANMMAGQGYIVAVQDKRGRYESEGNYIIFGGDADDGAETIGWLGKQPWSNGRVGTYGCSSLGDYQILAAQRRPPALKAMIPQASFATIGSAGGQYKYYGVRTGGAVTLAQNISWFYEAGSKVFYRPPPGLTREQFVDVAKFFNPAPQVKPADFPALWWHLPIVDIMKAAGAPPTDFADAVSRDVTDPWWDQFHYMTDDYHSDVPALFVNSWYDYGARETIFEFEMLRRNSVSALARDNQFLLLSPTTHCRSEALAADDRVGDRDVGDARFDFWSVYFKWYAYWLKGEKNAVTSMPRVQYYLMGKNEWRTASDWPVPGTRLTKFFLGSAGHANSLNGDGMLSSEPSKVPSGDEASDSFTYDPGNPVPSLGGPLCCTDGNNAAGSYDQRKIEIRNDVLVYTTPVISQGIEVTGPIDAVLSVSSDAKDTDFTAKLIDVYPDGRAFNVQEGILRARYREGQTKSVWMPPNEAVVVRIDVGATSNFFGPGHRIRLEVASSNFPRFDRNLNTGGKNYDETAWKVAHNRVHHSGAHPSYLLLPVVEGH